MRERLYDLSTPIEEVLALSAVSWPPVARWLHCNEVVTDGGLVVAPDPLIAEAGAHALREGGNAVDAAVAAAFADGVVEPPMSGVGGSAALTIAFRDPERFIVVEGHMVAPFEATPEHYPLAAEQPDGALASGGWSVKFFDYPNVEGFANMLGPKSVAVPGAVASLLAAQERYGRLRREQVLEPAIALAANGFRINWFVAALLASEARSYARDPGCAEIFLKGGAALRGPVERPADRLVQPQLARTLEHIAAKGVDAFYRGEIGESIVRAVRAGGGLLSAADLERYRPTIIESPPTASFGRFRLAGAPVSGFPTVLEAVQIYDEAVRKGSRLAETQGPHDDPVAWARALLMAFEDRFAYMSTAPEVSVPWDGLRSRAYARARLDAHLAGEPAPDPHRFSGESPSRRGPATVPGQSGHTSQMTVVDREGNIVSLTATILANGGARILDPETGVLLNNGIAYFDPRPDTPNGIRPGARVLSAMTPVVMADDRRGPFAGFGAAGGRRIISGVAQILVALATERLTLQEAVEAPRIHIETGDVVLLDARWPRAGADALEEAGFRVEPTVEEPTTVHFARPNGVFVGFEGERRSGVDPGKPGGIATG
ncbi:MAG: gamma-glutamyltransferase [Actinomycetota bacterium]